MRIRAGIAALLIASGAVWAGAPEKSLRPVVREHIWPPALPSFAPDKSPRPVARPVQRSESRRVAPAEVQPRAAPAGTAVGTNAGTTVAAAEKPPAVVRGRDGAETTPQLGQRLAKGMSRLCGDRDLVGQKIAPVPGKLPGCGISAGAIKLYEVHGVTLSTPSIMTCDTARALGQWVDKGMNPSVKRYGGGVAELKVAAHYSCRTRNNRKGARISEHGKGNAIDLSEFRLKNGDTISVLRDWGKGRKGRILKKMHRNACGPFGTVLGPRADRYHKDHFHFDVARHRGGPYCR